MSAGTGMGKSLNLQLDSKHDGVKPALQGRSRQRQSELINAGIKLLCEKNISEISIIELTATCGYTVGTFYSRFDDKDSFFFAVQEAAVAKMVSLIKEGFSDPAWKTASAEEIFANLVDITVDVLESELRGVVKESILASCSNQKIWIPIRECGRQMAKIILELLEPLYLENEPEESIKSIQFGLQMFYGTLVQAAINNPGPVKLEDPEFRENLTRMLTQYAKLKP